ncbi:MAG TPA: DNA repair protein RecN [Candidatus Limnocylindrales bacterium]|nr:DNA repair protein RecN [Candidatus Limnocylindrales bacterium]
MSVTVPDTEDAGRLVELTVTDLALIDRLRLEFDAGFNVITGETGAGKSLLIDALGLAMGARADTTLVRHGMETARVEALFDRLPEPLIAVREVAANGRSTARLDDTTVTAARLADEVGGLVEIHGQHDQGRLLDERWQRDLLDGFGEHEALRTAMASAVERWRENRAVLDAAALDPREVARRLDLLEHESSEIARANLRPGESDEIRARLTAAQHGEAIARGAAALREALTQEGAGARDATAIALNEARGIARLDPRFEPLADRLAGLDAELADVADEARRLAEDVDHDPRAVAELDARLGVIHGLLRRYGDDEASVLAHGERAAAEAERLRGFDEERARRQGEDARLLADVGSAAGALSAARRGAAASLKLAVATVLEELGFPPDVFEVAIGRRPAGPGEAAVEVDGDAVAFDGSGIDEVVYRLAPNPGEPARPLAKIASGGELSRVALAIKRVLAEADATPTLIFDEVDTGIGGRSADPIGRSLWGLARRHQVLCVTHLPQIASHADAHYRIVKRERDGRTVTEVERLDREGRIVELAAMLGGGPGDAAALASAREILDRAEAWRAGPVGAAGGDRSA